MRGRWGAVAADRLVDTEISLMDEWEMVKTFTGHRIARVTTRTRFNLRWTEMRLYRLAPGDEDSYVLGIVGRSRVYHAGDDEGGCNQGVEVRPSDLDPDVEMVPCQKCHPVDVSADGADGADDAVGAASTTWIKMEIPAYSLHICRDPQALMTALETDHTGRLLDQPSWPARQLMQGARRLDPDLNRFLSGVERL